MSISSRSRALGGVEVRRVLPSGRRRTVGPFIFFDEMGPLELLSDRNLEVRPHPHIGLATVTYLFSGAMTHRDSLGNVQRIVPGDVNWMTAGRGIVHSERTSDSGNVPGLPIHGVQTWVALHREREEVVASFAHHGASELPAFADSGLEGRVLLGSAWGLRSPVAAESAPVLAELRLRPGARAALPSAVAERALYVVSGRLRLAGKFFEAGTLAVLQPRAEVVVAGDGPLHVLLIGGEPLDGPRLIWWNFVSSSQERIEQAKADWRARRFGEVPGDADFVPLPD